MKFQTTSSEGTETKLSNGWHPAYLVKVGSHATPEGWAMQTPQYFRWYFAVWEDDVAQKQGVEFEKLDGISSTAFNDKSKAYRWVGTILNVTPKPGETIDLEPLYPIPCTVRLERVQKQDRVYAKITDVDRGSGWQKELEVRNDVRVYLTDLVHKLASGQAPATSPADIPDPAVPPAVI